MLFNRITLVVASERTAIAGRCSSCGFEMGVCRTWWKRVSYASEMHARLKALLERMTRPERAVRSLICYPLRVSLRSPQRGG